jgi:malate synthase
MTNASTSTTDIEITAKATPEFQEVLSPAAQQFLLKLEREFRETRQTLLQQRIDTQAQIDRGTLPEFLPQTRHIRDDSSWSVGTVPGDLQNRRVEITGPTDRKMMINALNSGANVFMADFEDANSPTWQNLLQGHINLKDAIAGTISYASPDGKKYQLKEKGAVLMVRPRGWHFPEKHFLVDGVPMSGSLFDAGLYVFHNYRRLLEKGTAPYFYLPKLENYQEAKLWNDVFLFMQKELDLPPGTFKATVLIETILAALQMEEILYELRDHIVGLNAGRWDYIFSIIKKLRKHSDVLFPDRSQISMAVPFMRAYTELLVRTCHKRGAHAIGGMAAFIPNRKDAAVTEMALAKVREDKERECADGFDGTWVAHPDLVSIAREPFDRMLGDQPHQKDRLREDVVVTSDQLLDFHVPGGCITESGLRNNISVAVQYLDAWLKGIGAVAIYNLMEDAATAEISRSQLWQWIHHPLAILDDGRKITAELYRSILAEEFQQRSLAVEILDQLVTDPQFANFLTLPAYEYLDQAE